jgi:hypothetical protein
MMAVVTRWRRALQRTNPPKQWRFSILSGDRYPRDANL